MNLYNLKDHSEVVSFAQAVKQGLGRQQGLFFPQILPVFSSTQLETLLKQDFATRSTHILAELIGDELTFDELHKRVVAAFTFPVPVKKVTPTIATLELFHGPTLAFKDFGGRFMAQMLSQFAQKDQRITILTATSGDTGAAVAHAFYQQPNIDVVVLYPKGKISHLQEKLFCTLGGNIHTIAIESDFDACQQMVKMAFDDHALKTQIGLNSANSINISRLLAQVCYYFEAYAQLSETERTQLVVSVPSGNFGDLTAGLLAKAMGLPIKRFIAATNENDTVPRYLETGHWAPKPTIATLSNAMDVSQPNNWPRIEEIFSQMKWPLTALGYGVCSDKETKQAMQELDTLNYLSEPHGAIAYSVLKSQLCSGEFGLFLGTAHPAKFEESVASILKKSITLPEALSARLNLPLLSHTMPANFATLRQFLMAL